jgi:hypothetical protein
MHAEAAEPHGRHGADAHGDAPDPVGPRLAQEILRLQDRPRDRKLRTLLVVHDAVHAPHGQLERLDRPDRQEHPLLVGAAVEPAPALHLREPAADHARVVGDERAHRVRARAEEHQRRHERGAREAGFVVEPRHGAAFYHQ